MSIYQTIATSEDLNDPNLWHLSVAMWDNGDPVRINHGQHEWYLPTDVALAVASGILDSVGDADAE